VQIESRGGRTVIVARSPGAWTLSRSQLLPRSPGEVFGYFADAANLEAITPPFLRFRIRTPLPVTMREGTLLEYELGLFGVPFRWLTRIDAFEPQRRFVDRQLRGPYRRWVHLHEFRAVAGGTEIRDRVDYEIGFGPFGRLAHALFVRRSLERIFEFRAAELAARFAAGPELTACDR
jgi:ligand-binding SRPBCC domain-containing protein